MSAETHSQHNSAELIRYAGSIPVVELPAHLNLTGSVSPGVSIGTAVDGVEPITITIDHSSPVYESFFWRLKAE
ncbi:MULTISPECIES: hypothetical protein [unclassified Lentimonas]|uniref:hypothetical protein n=1 Tax=unclassified Lentimonas TaxID=2630993 RepID=UPI00138A1E64|nr:MULTISPECIES: hypothetical protein [unclassified Lentimonas]